MKEINYPKVIQGGMGTAVSSWKLAKAVAMAGHLGVVSGTGLNTVALRRLQDGDHGGHIRRALSAFFDREAVERFLFNYYRPDGRSAGESYKRDAMPSAHCSVFLQQNIVMATFAEVYLAKEGHDGLVGINLLEKIQIANLPTIYGAMLAGVDYILMGAGIPREIPGVLDKFVNHESVSIKLFVAGSTSDREDSISFDPEKVFPNLERKALKRPKFLGIISSATLASHLAKKSTGKIDGFIVEGATAGGHNAPPRGTPIFNERGEPVYGEKDLPDLEAIKKIGLPFWLAGAYATPDRLQEALNCGAAGVQIGTAFAYCEESGLPEKFRAPVIKKWASQNTPSKDRVFTDPLASPTGFPFKVLPLEGSLSDNDSYESRPRRCDLGYLRQLVAGPDGSIIYRCAAEPIDDFVRKGGSAEDAIGRKCLCNALMANIGIGQTQRNGDVLYDEPPLFTAGDDVINLSRYLNEGKTSFTAIDIIEHVTT